LCQGCVIQIFNYLTEGENIYCDYTITLEDFYVKLFWCLKVHL